MIPVDLLEWKNCYCTGNVLLAGAAGVGKSFVMRAVIKACILENGPNSVVILAPTQVAARNIGGQTIASFLGSNFDANMRQELRFVFIDDVCMISAKELDRISEIFNLFGESSVHNGKARTFGGLKVLLAGDLLQMFQPWLTQDRGFFQSNAFIRVRVT